MGKKKKDKLSSKLRDRFKRGEHPAMAGFKPEVLGSEESLFILAHLEETTARIQGVEPTRLRPEMVKNEKPVTGRNWTRYPIDTEQIRVALYRADDLKLVRVVSGERRRGVHVDQLMNAGGARVMGGVRSPKEDTRLLHVDAREANYIAIFRVRVEPRPGRGAKIPDHYQIDDDRKPGDMLRVDLLAAYGIARENLLEPRNPGQLPPPFEVDRSARSGGVTVPDHKYSIINHFGFTWESQASACGQLRTWETIHYGDKPVDKAFNVVILGDGFGELEYAKFDKWARRFAKGLLSKPPYQEHEKNIKIHLARTISMNSHVPGCPCECHLCTYYGVEGNWKENPEDQTYPAFFGIPDFQRIYTVGELFAKFEYVGLYVVLVNCRVAGGSAYIPERTIFLALGDDPFLPESAAAENFIKVGIHEASHVVGILADEYIACDDGNNFWYRYRNAYKHTQGTNYTPSWNVNIQHEFHPNRPTYYPDGDPIFYQGGVEVPRRAVDGSPDPYYRTEVAKEGVWWGCQYVDGLGEGCGNPYSDPRGHLFMRSHARCLMRTLDQSLCQVCTDAVKERLGTEPPFPTIVPETEEPY